MKSTEFNPEGINWLKAKGIAEKEWKSRYLYSIYWAVTTMLTVGYGDVTPTNENEMMFNIAAMFLGCGMFGYSMNSIGEILKFSGRDEQKLKEQMKHVNNMMKGKNLPSETEIKIRKYMEFVWKQEQKENPGQEKIIMNKLSSKLRDEIYLNTNVKLLKSVPALNTLSNKTLITLSSYMKKVRLSPEEHVYKEGDFEDLSLYFVIDGTLELVKERDGAKYKSIPAWTTYQKDDYFGVYEFFTGKSRSLAVVSVDFSTLFQLSRRDILYVLQKNQEELEKFSRIKDLELLYGLYEQYKINCLFCSKQDHSLNQCRFFSYKPSRQLVIGKYVQRKKRFMNNFLRKPREKVNSLLQKSYYSDSLNDFLTVYYDDDDLKELINYYEALFNNNTNSNINDEKSKDLDSPTRCNPDEESEGESEETKNVDEEFGKRTEYPTSLSNIDTNKSHRSGRNLTILTIKSQRHRSNISTGSFLKVSANDAKSEKRGKSEKELTLIKHDNNSNNKPKDLNLEKKRHHQGSQTSFDRVKQYRFYFPRNNVNTVVSKMNKKIIKTMRSDFIFMKSNYE